MIKGKIASLINSRTVAINVGSDEGVELGMYFNILSNKKSKITDPDTNEELGEVEVVKSSVRVVEVMPKYCLAETYNYATVNEGGSVSSISKLLQPPKLVKVYETLNIDKGELIKTSDKSTKVKIGDSVIQTENR